MFGKNGWLALANCFTSFSAISGPTNELTPNGLTAANFAIASGKSFLLEEERIIACSALLDE